MNCLVSPKDFLGLEDVTHLYTAAECPLLVEAADAMANYASLKGKAERGRRHHDEVTNTCRANVAALFNATPEEIAFLGSASDAINAVAGVLSLSPGDNVVINDLEFPSVALPWMRLRAEGLEVRVVHHENWTLPTDLLLSAIDDRTRLVALSHVSYVNGWRHDVAAIAAALANTNTMLLLDVTQSAGIFPIEATLADFVVSSTYKWLLGTHGLGVLYLNKNRPILSAPKSIGWYSLPTAFTDDRYERYTLRSGAGQFETGYLNFPAIYALNVSLPYLQALPPNLVVSHVHTLGDELIDGFKHLNLTVTTPARRADRGASVTFLHDDAMRIGSALARQEIHVWAGDGRVRASPNVFNSSDDIASLLNALAISLKKTEQEALV